MEVVFLISLDERKFKLKRAFLLALSLILSDQMLKWFFQTQFNSQRVLLTDNIGFTYVTNPGIYVSSNISELSIVLLQIFVLAVWIGVIYSVINYNRILGKSLIIDLSFAFLTTGFLGNLILDRLFLGVVRDYFIIPLGVANLADFCGMIALMLISIQIYRSPEFRDLLFRGIQPIRVSIEE